MKYLLVIFILLQTGRSFAQTTFSRLYNMADTSGVGSGAYGMLVDDSSVYLVGNYFNHLSFKVENFLAKLDMNGNVLWRKSYAYPGKNSHFVSSTGFKRLQSGDFLMLTRIDSIDTVYNVGLSVPRLRRIDPNGNVVSEHYLPVDNHSSWLYEFTELGNGDLAFTGSIRSKTYIGLPEFGGISYFFRWSANVLFLTYSSLSLKWITVSDTNFYGSQTGFPDLYRMATLNDSIILQIGSKENPSVNDSYQGAFVAYSRTGNKLWETFIPSRYKLLGVPSWGDAEVIDEDRFFFVSHQADSIAIPPGISFMNTIVYGYLNSQGDTTAVKRKRYKIYVPDLRTDQVSILPDKSKIIVTQAQYIQSGVGLTKLAPNDSLLWERSIRYIVVDTGSASSGFRQFAYAPNGDLLLASSILLSGTQWDSTGGYSWLVKLDSFGCLVPGCHLGDSIFRPDTPVSLPIVQYANQMEWLVYPNPSSDFIKIELKSEFLPAGLKVGLLSLDGKLIQEYAMEGGKVKLDLNALTQGVYLCRLLSDDGVISYRKIVKSQ